MFKTCVAPAIDGIPGLGGPRCNRPATHLSLFGYCCDEHAEKQRQSMRDRNTVANLISGRTRTEEEIARLIRPLPPA